MRPVVLPVGALVVEIGAQEIVDALLAVPHLRVGRAGSSSTTGNACAAAAAPRAPRGSSAGRHGRRLAVRVGERQFGRPGERRAHQRQRAEHVGPDQRAPRRHRGAEIVPDHRGRVAIAERRDQAQHVAHAVQQPERPQIVVVIGAPPGRAAIAAQIRRDGVKPGLGERRHHLAPGIGDFRKPVQQHDERPARPAQIRLRGYARRGR